MCNSNEADTNGDGTGAGNGGADGDGSAMVINIPSSATKITINAPNATIINAQTSTKITATSETTTTTTAPATDAKTATANLANLLPTATFLVFQAVTPILSNNGACSITNKYLVALTIGFIAASCIFSSFTDSFTNPVTGEVHYGVATLNGFFVLNYDRRDKVKASIPKPAAKYRLCKADFFHAVFSFLVFLVIAFSDANVHGCFFPDLGENEKEIVVNSPIAAWVLASFLFTLVPTTRRGIGYADKSGSAYKSVKINMLAMIANLANLLPTGTVLAFQALTPSFSNNGSCNTSNKIFIAAAIGVNGVVCFLSSFTDSFTENGKVYYGFATGKGLYTFTSRCDDDDVKEKYRVMEKYELKISDFVHAIGSLVVFLVIAFSSTDVYGCYFPDAAEEAFKYLPLGASVVASGLFAWMPTKRRGIGYADAAAPVPEESEKPKTAINVET